MTLDKLERGKSALIDAVLCEDVTLRKHILDMGLTAGTQVTYVKDVNGVMEIRVRGYELALLYTPCVATVAATKRELGGKWASMLVVEQCVIAWLVSFVVSLILGAVGIFSASYFFIFWDKITDFRIVFTMNLKSNMLELL